MLSHNDVCTRVEQSQQLRNADEKLLPMFGFHGVADFRIVVEDGRNNAEFDFDGDADAEIVGFWHGEEFVEHFNLLAPIRTWKKTNKIKRLKKI